MSSCKEALVEDDLESAVNNYRTHPQISRDFHRLIADLSEGAWPFRISGSVAAGAFSTLKRPDFDLSYVLDLKGTELERHVQILPCRKRRENRTKFNILKVSGKEAAEKLKEHLHGLMPKEHGTLLNLLIEEEEDGGFYVSASHVRKIMVTISYSRGLPVRDVSAAGTAVKMNLKPDYLDYKSSFIRGEDEESVRKRKLYALRMCNAVKMEVDVDLALEIAVSYDRLPEDAKKWERRARRSKSGWPGADLIEAVKKKGGHFATKTDNSGELTRDFRLSLSLDTLLAAVPDYKEVLVILKDLVLTFVQGGKVEEGSKAIGSFILNNSIAWAMEESETERPERHQLVRGTLDFMVRCYRDKYLPMYFDEESNLLEGMTVPEKVEAVYQKLLQVKINLPGYILQLTYMPMTGSQGVLDFIKTLYYLSKDDKEEEAMRFADSSLRQLQNSDSIRVMCNKEEDASAILLLSYLAKDLPPWLNEWISSDVLKSHRATDKEPGTDYDELKELVIDKLLPRLKVNMMGRASPRAAPKAEDCSGYLEMMRKGIMAAGAFLGGEPSDAFSSDNVSVAELSYQSCLPSSRVPRDSGPTVVPVASMFAVHSKKGVLKDDALDGVPDTHREQEHVTEVEEKMQDLRMNHEEDDDDDEATRVVKEICPQIRELLDHHEGKNPEIAAVIKEVLAEYCVVQKE